MKKNYSKPELIDLNEKTGRGNGNGCRNGSGNTSGCFNGNAALGSPFSCGVGNGIITR